MLLAVGHEQFWRGGPAYRPLRGFDRGTGAIGGDVTAVAAGADLSAAAVGWGRTAAAVGADRDCGGVLGMDRVAGVAGGGSSNRSRSYE